MNLCINHDFCTGFAANEGLIESGYSTTAQQETTLSGLTTRAAIEKINLTTLAELKVST
jgi:hypothetical protein